MALFGDGICCGTCDYFESDFRSDCWCNLQGPGVNPMDTRVCRDWKAGKNKNIVIPDCLK
jgi:hypothetical protein